MERKLQERMIGAGVLVVALALLAPLLLDGTPQGSVDAGGVPGQRPDELRTHTFTVGGARDRASGDPAASDTRPTGIAAANPASQPPPPAASGPAPAATVPAAAAPAPDPVPLAPPPTAAASPAPKPVPAGAEPGAAPAAAPAKAPAPARAAPAASGGWVVQVGTFGQRENAERLATGLKGKGFAAAVSATSRAGKTMYRVRVGPAGSKDEARAVADRLKAAGQAGQVVPQ